MKYKYMVFIFEPGDSFERSLGRLAESGWRVRTHVPLLGMGPPPGRQLIIQGERIVLEKEDDDGLSDTELEAISTLVRAEMQNHAAHQMMAAKHGDYFPFASPNLDILLRELRRRGITE